MSARKMVSSLSQIIRPEGMSLPADLVNSSSHTDVHEDELQESFTMSDSTTAWMMIPLYREMAEDPTVRMWRYVAEKYMTLPLVVFGIIGNVVSFIVLCHHRRQRLQTTTTLLQGLAVADTLVLINVFLLRTMRYLFPGPTATFYHAHIYVVLFPVTYILRLVNTWLTVILTIDRYIATCRPLYAQTLCTMKRTYASMAGVVIASIVFCLPRFFENKTHRIDPVPLLTSYVYIFFYQISLFLLVQYLVPMVLLLVLNSFVVGALRRSTVYQASVTIQLSAPPACGPRYSHASSDDHNSGGSSKRGQRIGCSPQTSLSRLHHSSNNNNDNNAYQQQQQQHHSLGVNVCSIVMDGLRHMGGLRSKTPPSHGTTSLPSPPIKAPLRTFRNSTFESTRRVTIIVVVVVLLSIICNSVAMVAQVLWSINNVSRSTTSTTFDLWRRHVSQASNVLVTLNSASNFVIYCMYSRKFRSILARQFLCCFRRCSRGPMTADLKQTRRKEQQLPQQPLRCKLLTPHRRADCDHKDDDEGAKQPTSECAIAVGHGGNRIHKEVMAVSTWSDTATVNVDHKYEQKKNASI